MSVGIQINVNCDVCGTGQLDASPPSSTDDATAIAYAQTKGWVFYEDYGANDVDLLSCPQCEEKFGPSGDNSLTARLDRRHDQQSGV